MKTQRQMAKEIAAALGKKESNVVVFLSQIIHGKKKLPNDWVPAMLKATGCNTREELLQMYPRITFNKDLHLGNDSLITVKMTVHSAVADMYFEQLPNVVKAFDSLRLLGIDVEVSIRSKIAADSADIPETVK